MTEESSRATNQERYSLVDSLQESVKKATVEMVPIVNTYFPVPEEYKDPNKVALVARATFDKSMTPDTLKTAQEALSNLQSAAADPSGVEIQLEKFFWSSWNNRSFETTMELAPQIARLIEESQQPTSTPQRVKADDQPITEQQITNRGLVMAAIVADAAKAAGLYVDLMSGYTTHYNYEREEQLGLRSAPVIKAAYKRAKQIADGFKGDNETLLGAVWGLLVK